MSTLVSVDLDDARCYHQIHGVEAPSTGDDSERIVLERCLPRFLELFDEAGVRATFFVIGRDLERDLETTGKGADLLRQALAAGHELGNHSYRHAYDMVTWSGEEIASDVTLCDDLLRSLGAAPRGFRAPGYTHDAAMLQQVAALGYRYDSSSLPSPTYYLAKLGAMATMRMRGRSSHSMATGVGSFLGSTRPTYRPDVGLWEVPISVSRLLRIPLIGTFLLSGPAALASQLRREAAETEHLHLELHAIDLADAETDGWAAPICKKQPELQRSLDARRADLEQLFEHRGGGQTIGAAIR